jgi:hypothetical protein
MKKINLLVIFLILVRFTSNAQGTKAEVGNGFYGTVGAGFGIGLCNYDPCDYYYEDYYPSYDNKKSINFVPGRGFDVNLGAGYMFTKNLGVQMNVTDFIGLPIKTVFNNYNTEGNPFTENISYKGMILQIIPAVVLDLGLDKIDPYARFGMSIGVFPQISLKETEVRNNNTYDYTGKYVGGLPIGYSAAVGVKFKLNEKFGLYGEFDCNGINYTPNKYKMTKYSVNGVDRLADLPLSQTEIDFVKSYDASKTSTDTPSKQLKQTFPFSNFEINIGAAYKF